MYVCVCVIVCRGPHLFPAQITVVLLVLLFFEIGSFVLGQTPTCHPYANLKPSVSGFHLAPNYPHLTVTLLGLP